MSGEIQGLFVNFKYGLTKIIFDGVSGKHDYYFRFYSEVTQTREMISNLLIEMNRKIKETMGIEIELNTDHYFL